MPLWLDMLRTPMAAPETPALRADRRIWQALCVASAAAVLLIVPLTKLLGSAAAVLVAALLAMTAIKTCFYLARKKAADDRYLEVMTEDGL
jgi:homoserine kinase